MDIVQTSPEIPFKNNLQILVFRSNIDNNYAIKAIISELLKIDGIYDVNIDSADWENILRMECHPKVKTKWIEKYVAGLGFECSELQH